MRILLSPLNHCRNPLIKVALNNGGCGFSPSLGGEKKTSERHKYTKEGLMPHTLTTMYTTLSLPVLVRIPAKDGKKEWERIPP